MIDVRTKRDIHTGFLDVLLTYPVIISVVATIAYFVIKKAVKDALK